MKQFDDILHKAAEWRKENNKVALATVVSTWGSVLDQLESNGS